MYGIPRNDPLRSTRREEMDDGDSGPTWASLASKGHNRADRSDLDPGRCSLPVSEHSDDHEDLSRQARQTYSTIMAELNKEIDCSEFIGKAELQRIISTKLKHLLEKVLSKACRNLPALEQLRTAAAQTDRGSWNPDRASGDPDRAAQLLTPPLQSLLLKPGFSHSRLDKMQSYLMSAKRTCLHSELDPARTELDSSRTELADIQCRHQSAIRNLHHSLHLADQEKNQAHAAFQQSLRESETEVQSLQQQLCFSHRTIQSLREDLVVSEGNIQSLRGELRLAEDGTVSLRRDLRRQEEGGQVLRAALRTAEENVRLLQRDAHASEELRRSLQQRLSEAEEKARSLQDTLGTCEARAQVLSRSQEESWAKCERRTWRLRKVYQQQEERLRGTAEELQMLRALVREKEVGMEQAVAGSREENQRLERALDNTREEKQSLQRALDNTREENQNLQRALDNTREHAATRERELCAEIIVLKNKLLEEQTNRNKELEKSAMYEKELLETINHLRQVAKTHKEGRDLALDCLRKRCQDVADVQRRLEVDIRHCGGLDYTGLPSSERPRRELEANADGQGREEWAGLLRRADKWDKKAEELVNVLESLRTWSSQKRNHVRAEVLEEVLSALNGAAEKAPEPSQSLAVPPYCPLAAPPTPRQVHRYSASEVNTESLLSAQRSLRALQSVNFRNSIKKPPRSS